MSYKTPLTFSKICRTTLINLPILWHTVALATHSLFPFSLKNISQGLFFSFSFKLFYISLSLNIYVLPTWSRLCQIEHYSLYFIFNVLFLWKPMSMFIKETTMTPRFSETYFWHFQTLMLRPSFITDLFKKAVHNNENFLQIHHNLKFCGIGFTLNCSKRLWIKTPNFD